MKNSVGVLLLAAASTLSYGQNSQGNDNGQGDQQGRPAVPKLGRGEIRPHVWIRGFIGRNLNQAATTYMTPARMTAAYGINGVGSGQGATVVIVDAYDAPNVAADLASFMSTWGISCPTPGWGTFTEVNQNGGAAPLPGYDSGWEAETSMDTQWVRAIAPCANIVLVEANSNLDSDLMTAVSTAATLGSVVSMSWGGSESVSQTSYDSFFVKNGVTFLASSGDTGGVVEWPSSSPNVIGVGGTNLNYSSGKLVSETAWSGSGGGCSTLEPAIAAQTGFVPSSCKNRAAPDVSMDGGGSSPVYVLISGQGGWFAEYGTSLSVQLWAGVTALATALHGAPLNGVPSALYANAAGAPSSAPYITNYRDITSGSAGSFLAGKGWDFITGLGSPLVNKLVPLLGPPTPNFSISANPPSLTVPRGSAGNSTITVTSVNGFNSPVGLTVSGCPANTTCLLNPTSVTPPPNGATTSTLTVTASGTSPTGTVSLTVSGNSGVHTTTVSLTIADFSLSASPSSTTNTQGNPANSTITVTSVSGYHSAVTLSVTNCPAGAVCKFATNPVTPPANGSNTSALSVTGLVAGGPYSLTISGTDGTLTHTTAFTVTVSQATPTFSPAAGLYSTAQSVTIGTITSGASIRYTTDGSIPTSTTGILYSGAIMVSSTTTIRAIGYKSGFPDSAVASATYTIGSGPAWYDTSWTTRKQVTVDHTKVSGSSSLSNFPLLVSITDATLESTANGGLVGKSDGTEILFTSSDGMTKLDHELESYNAATGQVIAWVRIPSLSPTTDTAIYLYYGNSTAANQQNATGVWDSNYKGVWHFGTSGGLSTSDSSNNANALTNAGASASAGQIGGAANFDGVSNYMVSPSFDLSNTKAATISFWLNWANFSNTDMSLMELSTNFNNNTGTFFIDPNSSGGGGFPSGYFQATAKGNAGYSAGGFTRPSAGTWHHYSLVFDQTLTSGQVSSSMFVDGVQQSNVSTVLNADNTNFFSSNPLYLMSRGGSALFGQGKLDELRISTVARSTDWVITEYRNESAPSTFYSIGPTAGTGGFQVATPTFTPAGGVYSTAQSVTISTTTLGASIRYTTDGSIPTSTTGILYSGAIMVSSTTTIRAIAYASGAPDSAVASATYTIGSGPAWYNTGWTNRKAITIDHTKVSGSSNLSNFPILFSATDANMKSVPNGGLVGKSDGTDILFTASDGVTKLNHELETYNPGTGQTIAWVRIPTLSNTSDTVFYIYFGNASAANQQNATGVWDSNYKGVWHFGTSGGLSTSDSSNNANALTNAGASASAGQIGGAANFDGVSNYMVSPSFDLSNTKAATISFWLNWANFSNTDMSLMELSTNFNNNTGTFFIDPNSSGGGGFPSGYFQATAKGNAGYSAGGFTRPSAGTWHHYSLVFDQTLTSGQVSSSMFVDGVQQSNVSTVLNADNTNFFSSNPLYLMSRGGSALFGQGKLDELRISTVARSTDWVITEYRNESAPSTFYSIGPTAGTGGFQVATPTFTPAGGVYSTAQSVTISTTTLGASIRYTTDGSIPTSTTGIVYSGAIMVSSTTTIRAIAYASGAPDSAVASATYTIGSGPAWYDTSWTTRKQVTVDHTKVSGSSSLSNFPLLVSITDASLESTANGGLVGKSDGTDILFTSSDGMTRLDHELESYNAATGQVIAWVRIPSLSPTTDTAIYLYYGNSTAADQQNKTGVWDSNYKGVWHLPNGSLLTAQDSTSNSNNGSQAGFPTATAGQIGGAANFNGSNQDITMGNVLGIGAGAVTMSAWIKPPNQNQAAVPIISKRLNSGSFAQYNLGIGSVNNSGNAVSSKTIYCTFYGGSLSTAQFYHTQNNVVDGNWHYVACARNSSGVAIYVDGQNQTLVADIANTTPTDTTNAGAFNLAFDNGAAFYTGVIDEVEVSNTARSSDWITTEYNNQSSPSSFYSVGGQTSP